MSTPTPHKDADHLAADRDVRAEARMSDVLSHLNEDHVPAPDEALLSRLREQTSWRFMAASARAETATAVRAPEITARPSGRRRMVRWALTTVVATAAAVVLAVVLVPVAVEPKPAYGIADAPRILASAKTLHMQAIRWSYGPDPQFPAFEKATLLPMESWIDVVHARQHHISFESWGRGDERHLGVGEWVSDGELKMMLDHKRKRVSFSRHTQLTNRLLARTMLRQTLYVLSPGQLGEYARVGREQLNGRPFDIWERTHAGTTTRQPPRRDAEPEVSRYTMRVKCWISPDTGDVGRVEQWIWHEPTRSWRPEYFLQKVERDVAIPAEQFALDPPAGYEVTHPANQPVIAKPPITWKATFGKAELVAEVAFTLEMDGSVLLGWSAAPADLRPAEENEDEAARAARHAARRAEIAAAQAPIFANLEPGGPLPVLPAVIEELRSHSQPYRGGDETTYVGRHLAHTRRDGRLVEWALYVPQQKLTAPPPLHVYMTRVREPREAEAEIKDFNLLYGHPISGREEFDDFVRGAIAERAHDGNVPDALTYDNVMRVARQARQAQ